MTDEFNESSICIDPRVTATWDLDKSSGGHRDLVFVGVWLLGYHESAA